MAAAAAGSAAVGETASTLDSSLRQMQHDHDLSASSEHGDPSNSGGGALITVPPTKAQKQKGPNSSKRNSRRPSDSAMNEQSESEHTQMFDEAAEPQTRTMRNRNSDLSSRRVTDKGSRPSLRRPLSLDTLSGDEADGEHERSVEGGDAASDVEVEELHGNAASAVPHREHHGKLAFASKGGRVSTIV